MAESISIIIPVYNVAGYIETCLDSIMKQTFKNYEVIIVDDGSTDGTSDIIDQYASKYSNINVVHKKNEGVSVARNVGIDLAKGEYYLFFDGDDFVEPYCLEELYAVAKGKQADTVIYGYHRFEDGKIKETALPSFEQDLYENDAIMKGIFPRFIGISYDNLNGWIQNKENALFVENPALWRTMVSAEVIKKNHLYFDKRLKVGEDTLFISEYLTFAKRCYIQRKCYYYLVTRETSTIYVYEKKPLAKLDGKVKLLICRNELTDKINRRKKLKVKKLWGGTVVMSCMELAFLLAKKNPKYGYFKRYKLFLSYINEKLVQQTIKEFHLEMKLGIKMIPFLLLKMRLYFILFVAISMLQLVHYEFVRK